MSKEVYLVGCHIVNARQLELLNRLVDCLVDNKKDFILVSCVKSSFDSYIGRFMLPPQ